MSLSDLMLDQLAIARRIVEDGEEDQPDQRERALLLVSRFMTWKMATSFVMTAETWLGPLAAQEALLVVGVSFHERLAAVQRIRPGNVPRLDSLEWLEADLVDDAYWRLLPTGVSEISAEEINQLRRVFDEDGEMAAKRLS